MPRKAVASVGRRDGRRRRGRSLRSPLLVALASCARAARRAPRRSMRGRRRPRRRSCRAFDAPTRRRARRSSPMHRHPRPAVLRRRSPQHPLYAFSERPQAVNRSGSGRERGLLRKRSLPSAEKALLPWRRAAGSLRAGGSTQVLGAARADRTCVRRASCCRWAQRRSGRQPTRRPTRTRRARTRPRRTSRRSWCRTTTRGSSRSRSTSRTALADAGHAHRDGDRLRQQLRRREARRGRTMRSSSSRARSSSTMGRRELHAPGGRSAGDVAHLLLPGRCDPHHQRGRAREHEAVEVQHDRHRRAGHRSGDRRPRLHERDGGRRAGGQRRALRIRGQARPGQVDRSQLLDHPGEAGRGQGVRAPAPGGAHRYRCSRAGRPRDVCRSRRCRAAHGDGPVRRTPGGVHVPDPGDREGEDFRGSITIVFEGLRVTRSYSRTIG